MQQHSSFAVVKMWGAFNQLFLNSPPSSGWRWWVPSPCITSLSPKGSPRSPLVIYCCHHLSGIQTKVNILRLTQDSRTDCWKYFPWSLLKSNIYRENFSCVSFIHHNSILSISATHWHWYCTILSYQSWLCIATLSRLTQWTFSSSTLLISPPLFLSFIHHVPILVHL